MVKRSTIPITRRALLARLKRALAKEEQGLEMNRRDKSFVTVDYRQEYILDTNIDIEMLGRKLGVLKPWEKLADD
jgi:hypothetical protein